jgi:hypothetical protein
MVIAITINFVTALMSSQHSRCWHLLQGGTVGPRRLSQQLQPHQQMAQPATQEAEPLQ